MGRGALDKKRALRRVVVVAATAYGVALVMGWSVANRMIFVPPPPQYGTELPGLVMLDAESGDSIAAQYFPVENPRAAVLFAHGNGEDIGWGAWHAERYTELGVSVLIFDYPGYGLSTGTPTEAGSYSAVDAAHAFLLEQGFRNEQIIAHGRSLGGGVVADLAARESVGGLVLESTFVSAARVLTRISILPIDYFRTLSKLDRIQAPVFVIHGDRDAVVASWHGRTLFDALPEERRSSLWVQRAGHNDLEAVAGDDYWNALDDFLGQVVSGTP